nr:hypothetical protein [Tanacetum cinerariifolium]
LTSDIDSRTSCPTTRTGPMPMEVTTVVRQHPQIHLIRCKHSREGSFMSNMNSLDFPRSINTPHGST